MKMMIPKNKQEFALAAIQELKRRYSKRELWSKFKPQIIKDAAKKVGCKEFFPKQEEILYNPKRWTIIKAGRNSAKTYNAAFTVYTLLWFGGMFGYTMHITLGGPRAEDTENIFEALHYEFMTKDNLISDMFPCMEVVYDNFNNNAVHRKKMKFKNDSWIHSASTEHISMKDLRGDWNDLIIIDEFGGVAHKSDAVAAAQYSLNRIDPLNLLWLVGTPDPTMGTEFTDLYEIGQSTLCADCAAEEKRNR